MSAWIQAWLEENPAPPAQARPSGIELSYSQVRSFLSCPWQCKLRYVDFLRAPLSPAASLGISLHRALESYHRESLNGLEGLLQAYDDRWVHHGFTSAQEQMEWYRKGEDILRAYLEHDADRKSEVLGVEREFVMPLGPHQVIGTIDRIDRLPDGTHEIIDYKTHTDFIDEARLAEDLQMGIYAVGAREGLGIEPDRLTIEYVAVGRRVSIPCDPARDEAIKALVSRVADLMAWGRAFKADTSFCPKCAYRNRCSRAVKD